MNTIYYLIIFFIFGLMFGSFFNVVGCRLPSNKSIIFPSSKCPKCNKKLNFWELIPLFSYLFQLGRCRECKKRISIIYPIFEVLTGLLFVLSYMIFGLSNELIIALTFISGLIIIIISDLKHMLIPDEIIFICSFILLIEFIIFYGLSPMLLALGNAIIVFIIMLILKLFGDYIFKKESLGGGDVKLMFLIGLVLGIEISFFVIVISSFVALPISLIILIYKKTNIITFGPFLSLVAIILYLMQIEATTFYHLITK